MHFEPGQIVDGRYELIDVLGEGGFGVVYKALQRSTGQLVAIKILLVDRSIDDDQTRTAVGRFEREMKIIGRLRHPNIVRLIDSGQLESGELFLALEFVEGEPMHLVARREGGFDLPEATHLMTQVLEALAVAHQAGVVHRDLKPHNIMITSTGLRRNALVLDFGVAGLEEHAREDGDAELTADHAITGSPAYMAPEQIGRAAVSPRMDIYSWGLVYVEAITGKRAIPGDEAFQVMMAQVSDDPVPIPPKVKHLPLRNILRKALAKKPDNRYQDVATLLADLQAFDPAAPPPSDSEITVSAPPHPEVSAAIEGHSSIDTGDRSAPEPAESRSPLLAIAAIALVAVIAAGVWYFTRDDTGQEEQRNAETESAEPVVSDRSIAVLPFGNFSADAENEYFSDGLSEELIVALSSVDDLEVAPRTSSFAFKGSNKDIKEIAGELGVATVLEGSVRKNGDRIKVSAALIDGKTGKQLWNESWDRSMEDVFAIQEEIARAIVNKLEVELGSGQGGEKQIVEHGTENTEAYNLYLRGRFFYNKRNPEAARKAIGFLEEAIAIEPDYALAWSALADQYVIMAWFSWIDADIGYPKAEEAIAKVEELQPDLGEIYASKAVARLWYHYDWDGAEKAFRKAHELAPEFATARQWYGSMLLVPLARFEEGKKELAIARELDPIAPIIQTDSGDVGYYSGDHDYAIGVFQQTIDMHPDFFMGHYSLGRSLLQQGKGEEAVAAFEKARQLSNESTVVLASIGYAHGLMGNRDEAEAILQIFDERSEKEYVQAAFYARVYSGLGDKDKTLEFLEKAVEDHSGHIPFLKVDPPFAWLADDPRFQVLLDKIGITDWEEAHPDLAQPRPDHPRPPF